MRLNEKQISDVLDRAITGDEEAFSVLYQENVKKIYNYIFYRTGNVHDAEDLLVQIPVDADQLLGVCLIDFLGHVET